MTHRSNIIFNNTTAVTPRQNDIIFVSDCCRDNRDHHRNHHHHHHNHCPRFSSFIDITHSTPTAISTVTPVKHNNVPSVFELSKKIDSLLEVIKDIIKRTNTVFNLDGTATNAGKVLRVSEDGLSLIWDNIIIYTDVPPGPKSTSFPFDPKIHNLYLYVRDGQNTIVYRWDPTIAQYVNIGALVRYDNVAETMSIGTNALFFNSSGVNNVAFGRSSLQNNTTGSSNIGIGLNTLKFNTIGENNIAIGSNSGNTLQTGDNNIYVGGDDLFAVAASSSESNTTRIGNQSTNHTFVSGIWGTTTDIADAIPVLIDSAGQLGTVSSSAKYKENIEDMDDKTGFIYDLRPVTFKYKDHSNKKLQYGLIAEEVDKINPDLVVRKNGEPDTVHYDKFISILLNEIQKLNKRVTQLEQINRP